MTRRLIISAQPGERRLAVMEEDELLDFYIERADHPIDVGSLYLGRVLRFDRALDAAFVEIGQTRPGFLPRDKAGDLKLGDGDQIAVKVTRAPDEDKGAKLSALVELTPAQESDLRALKAPKLIGRGGDLLAQALTPLPDEILVDDREEFARIKCGLAAQPGQAQHRIQLDSSARPLFEREGLEAEIEALLDPRVPLPSGGDLLIEPVRTLTAIDVNAGRHDEPGGARRQAVKVNLEAAAEIARQIRLRALSGRIVIDFLDAGQQAGKEAAKALRKAMNGDSEPHRVVDFLSGSSLVQVTRRRSRPPLQEILTRPCGLAESGRVKDPATLAFELLRSLRAQAAGAPAAGATLLVSSGVAAALQGVAAPARAALEARLGYKLAIQREAARDGYGDYEIVLK